MLARYKHRRGRLPERDPKGVYRLTTFSCRKHCLHPEEQDVRRYLKAPTAPAWNDFERRYLKTLHERYQDATWRDGFDEVARIAAEADYYIGCWCPTRDNPDVNRCHTVLALRFMKEQYPRLEVQFPE